MKKTFKYIAPILAFLILGTQAGFFAIHHHEFEVEAHKCSHDGEHDFTYHEDCDICDIYAHQTYIHQNLDFSEGLVFFEPVFFTLEDKFLPNFHFLPQDRGPPSVV